MTRRERLGSGSSIHNMIKEYKEDRSDQLTADDETYFREAWKKNWSDMPAVGFDYYLRKDELTYFLRRFLPKGERIVEAGCGAGDHLKTFSRTGYAMYGIDYEPDVICRLKAFDSSLPVQVADVRNLPFKDESVGCYVSLGVMEHFEEGCDGILREARRILKRRGLILVAVPYASGLFGILHGRLSKKLRNPRFWQFRFTKQDLAGLLEGHAFQVKAVYLVNQMHGLCSLVNPLLDGWGLPRIPEKRLPSKAARYVVWPLLKPFSHLVLAVGEKLK